MLKKITQHHEFMWGYIKGLYSCLKKPIFVFLFFLAISICLGSSLAFYYLETAVNPLVTSFFDALYFVVTTMAAVGYGDIVPKTTGGRIISMAIMILGTGIYATFTAVLATALIELEISQEEP